MPKAKLLKPIRDDAMATNLARLINEKHGGSVRACAVAAGVDYNTLWRMVSGYHRPTRGMSQDMLIKLSAHFKVSVDRLIKPPKEKPEPVSAAPSTE